MDNEYKNFINKSTISCRSDSTKCNISAMCKNEEYKKDRMIMVVGSSTGRSKMDDLLQIHRTKMEREFNQACVNLAEAGRRGSEAGIALADALSKLKPVLICPEDMIAMHDMNFSGLEKIVIDFMTMGPKPTKFAGRCYDESGEISKKAYKQLMKKLDKKEKVSHKQDQTDHWRNKWNKKIKRKL